MNASPTISVPRVTTNLTHAFGGVWRLTFRRFVLAGHWITVAVGLAVLTLLCLGSGRHGGGTGHYVGWVCGFYVTFLVPALAFMAGAGAVREELKSSTVDYVLTRPIPRPAFVVFKFLAHTVCAQIDFLLALGVVLAVGRLREVPDLWAAVPPLLVGQMLLVTAFNALGFFFGALTGRYLVLGLAYALIIEVGVGQIPTQISRLSMTSQVRTLLNSLMDRAADVASLASWLATSGVLLAFCAVAVAATAAVFTMREFAGTGES